MSAYNSYKRKVVSLLKFAKVKNAPDWLVKYCEERLYKAEFYRKGNDHYSSAGVLIDTIELIEAFLLDDRE